MTGGNRALIREKSTLDLLLIIILVQKMKSRDESLNSNWGTICTLVPLVSEDGNKHKGMASTTEGIFRLIQSIPSPKAEPFRLRMAQVAAQRLDQ